MAGKLAIVDWGIGGFGLYREIKARSTTPVLYFSDNGHTPYGITPVKDLHARLDNIFQFLFLQGADKIAIACNAASAAFVDTDDVNGIINHGVSLLKNGDPNWQQVGLLAGRGTVQTKSYAKHLKGLPFSVRQRVSQPLSAHIEAGRIEGDDLHTDLKKIMAPLRKADAILLACTHYPAIAPQIAKYLGDDCQLLDPAETMADWILGNWHGLAKSGRDHWFTTGDPAAMAKNALSAFKVNVPEEAITTIRPDLSAP